MGEEVDYLVKDGGASEVMDAHELQDSHQLVGVELVVVEFLLQLVDNFKEISFEVVVVRERLLPGR